MAAETKSRQLTVFGDPFRSTFWPDLDASATDDPVLTALNAIRCSGARGAGINGHTALFINMHSWHGTRGLYIAKKVRNLYDRGCYVRILYSFLGKGTYNLLKNGTGGRMIIRRTLFPRPNSDYAGLYSHLKSFAVAGRIGGNSSAYATYTGSENFSDRSIRGDEVMVRIPYRTAFAQYRKHWNFMRTRRSSGTWATYLEPSVNNPGPERKAAARTPVLADGNGSPDPSGNTPIDPSFEPSD